jgi:hypothetical protein
MAIDPISLGIGAAGSAIKGITGAAQYFKGKNLLKDLNRPTYEIPEEIAKNMSIAEKMALQGLPEEQKKQYIENLNRQTGATLSGFSSRKAGLTGLTDLADTQSQAFKNLMVEDATAKQQNQFAAMQQRNIMASYRDKAFEYNKAQPYENTLAEGQALQGAGMQNIFAGIDEIGGTALMAGLRSGEDDAIAAEDGSGYDPYAMSLLSNRVKGNWGNNMRNQYYGNNFSGK